MGIIRLVRTWRSLKRLRQILRALGRHGFGELVERLHLSEKFPSLKRYRVHPEEAAALPREVALAKRTRIVLEELGPTFVKLGQMLSGRPDLLPAEFITELGLLCDHVKPFEFAKVRQIVEQELGAGIEDVFKEFEVECVASGSIAQVHRAVLADGRKVVVKVKRPGIERIVSTDIDLMMQLARLLERRIPELKFIRPTMIIEEFARGIRREMDFVSEASQTQRFGKSLEGTPNVKVPRVFWDYTTSSVLTLERIEGVPISELAELDRRGVDRKKLAWQISDVFMRQFFVTGIFHADPHPGNLFVCDRGVLGILDFGLVGQLTDELREQLATLMIGVVHGDPEMIIDLYLEMGIITEGPDLKLEELRSDLHDMINRYYGIPLKHIDNRRFFLELMESARRHGAKLPREFVLLGRSFTIVESLARKLDPDFDINKIARPYANKLVAAKLSPTRLAAKAWRSLYEILHLLHGSPRRIRDLIDRILKGKFEITLKHEGLDSFTLELERASNRLSFSVVVAALIVGSSLILVSKVGPKIGQVSIMGIIGYITAGLMGLWLLIAILRRGRL